MNWIKIQRHIPPLMVVVLCLVLNAPAQDTISALDRARQIVATTNDNATTLPERKEALQKLEDATQLFLSAGEKVEAARVLNRVGRLHLALDSPQDAIAAHNQALLILKDLSSVEVEVDSLNGLAAAYLLGTDKTSAGPTLNRSITLSNQEGYDRGRAQALLTLSQLQNYDSHVDALKTAQDALALWQTVGDKQAIARTYQQVGSYYMAQNMLPESTANFEQALQLLRDLGDSPGQAAALIMLGYIDIRRAEWQSSISRFIQAQALIDENADPEEMGQIACGMAEVYNFSGLPEVGLRYYERALDYYRRTQISDHISYVTWGIGMTYYLQQKYPDALMHFEESLTYLNEIQVGRKAMNREYMGRVFLETGDYPAALEALQFALDVYTESGNPMEMARVQALIGSVFERQGQLARARRNYLEALRVAQRVYDPVREALIYHALGRIELKSGQLNQAEEYLLRSLALTEKMQGGSISRDLRTAFYGSVHDRYQTYIEYLMTRARTSPNTGYEVRAFEMSESARARSLAEFFRTANASLAPGIDPELALKEKSLRQALTQRTEYRSLLLSKKGTPGRTEELSVVNADLSRLEVEYNEVLATINKRYPAYAQITQPVPWTLRRIQEEVIENDRTMLLEYSLGREKSYAWTVTRDSMKVFELPSQDAITSAAQKVYELLKFPPLPENESKLSQASRELSQLILAPLASELDKQMIIVAADGALNYVPFQILPAPSTNELLVNDFEIINSPSASILGDLRQEAAHREPATRLLAAFGDPVFEMPQVARNTSEQTLLMQAPSFARWRSATRDLTSNRDPITSAPIPRLFFAARELANLRELAGEGALVVSEFAATRENLLKTDLSRYAMLHFATHGYFDPSQPENSGLLLSTTNSEGKLIDGFVGLNDIYHLRAPQMVVMSACETALGKDVQGEGLVGLTRGFMYAGAASVVATLWKVDDAATAELMKLFYSNMLQRGMNPGEALRAAQNSIRQQPQWNSPYYWAAFVLQGEHRQIAKPPAPEPPLASRWKTGFPAAVVIALVGVAALFLWRRRRMA